MKNHAALLALALCLLAPSVYAVAQQPVRTSGVTVGDPAPEKTVIELVYTYGKAKRGYTVVNFFFHCYDDNVYLSASAILLEWDTKALKLVSVDDLGDRAGKDWRTPVPRESKLDIERKYLEDEQCLRLWIEPAGGAQRALMSGDYYIGTLTFKNKTRTGGSDFELGDGDMSVSAADGTPLAVEFTSQEYE